MKERWKKIKGYDGAYLISNKGRVWSVERVVPHPLVGYYTIKGKFLKHSFHTDGYPLVTLNKGGVGKTYNIHTLVARHFIGKCPKGKEVRHLDGDSSNPDLRNLKYGTPKQNAADRFGHGTAPLGEKNGQAKLTWKKVARIRKYYSRGWLTQDDLAEMFGVSQANIHLIIKEERWKPEHDPKLTVV